MYFFSMAYMPRYFNCEDFDVWKTSGEAGQIAINAEHNSGPEKGKEVE